MLGIRMEHIRFLLLPYFCLVASAGELDIGLTAKGDADLRGGKRFRALGPLIEMRSDEDGATFMAVRPIFSRLDEPAKQRSLLEFLWPVGMVKRSEHETFWRVLMAFGHDFDNMRADSRFRFVLFPVLFAGRDANDENYFAVFPIGGTVHEFLGKDRILFVLFPLYAGSSAGNVESRTVLWPMISMTKGGDLSRFRVFPFYGRSVKGELWKRQFVLWPLWTSIRYDYPNSSDGGFVLFPLFGRVKMRDQHAWTVLPPLFRWSSGDDQTEVNCPWPLIQYGSGKTDKFHIWPLYGRKSQGNDREAFFLWPLVSARTINRQNYVLSRFSLFPLLHHERRRLICDSPESSPSPGGETGISSGFEGEPAGASKGKQPASAADIAERRLKVWPLISYRREGDASHLRALELWPFRDVDAIERNMAPLWTLYSRTRAGEAMEEELLWGVFRRRRDGIKPGGSDGDEGRHEWSFLRGLVAYNREGLRKSYRLLYFLKFNRGGP